MDFMAMTHDLHSELQKTLEGRGIKPSQEHSNSLHTLLGSLAFNFHGKKAHNQMAVLSSLSPGQAKTTALLTFVNYVLEHPNEITESGDQFHEVGVLVCINTLDEIEAFASQINDRSSLCVWVGNAGEQEERCRALGEIEDPREAQVLVTTHKRIEMELNDTLGGPPKDFWSATSLSFSKGKRLVRVWDEAFLAGNPVVLSLRDLRRAVPYLADIDTEASARLQDHIEHASTLLEPGLPVSLWNFPAIWQKHNLDHDELVGQLRKDKSISDDHLEVLSDTFQALSYISGKEVVIRNDGNQLGNTLLTYSPTIPDSFLPVIVLDASGAPGIRKTYDKMVENETLTRLPHVEKRYEKFKIDIWKVGGGKSTFIESFDNRITGIANWITKEVPEGEEVLIIHHRPDTPEQLKTKEKKRQRKQPYRPIMPDMEHCLKEHLEEHHPFFDVSRLKFTTWGKHRAQNKWKDIPNVVAAGTLFKPDSVYEATFRIAKRYLPQHGPVSREEFEEFKLGEYADDLLQGLGRICIRQPDGADSEACPSARALVIAHEKSGIPPNIQKWFPGATLRRVVLMPEELTKRVARVVEHLSNWRKLNAIGATIKTSALKKLLGISNAEWDKYVKNNDKFLPKLEQLDIVRYKKEASSKNFQGFQITADIENDQAKLLEERSSSAAVYGFVSTHECHP